MPSVKPDQLPAGGKPANHGLGRMAEHRARKGIRITTRGRKVTAATTEKELYTRVDLDQNAFLPSFADKLARQLLPVPQSQ